MGRKRIDKEKRKERIAISLTKSIIDDLKKNHENVSQYIESLIIEDQKKKSKEN